MNKILLILITISLSACSTIKHIPIHNNNVPISNADTVTSYSEQVYVIPSIIDEIEKYSIISLFEEHKEDPLYSEEVTDIDNEELFCLAETMYFEARGEGDEGMLAVGHVVMNRMADSRFPGTVCGVIKQGKHVNGKPVRNRCQFSWYCDGLPDTVTDQDSYIKAIELALQILTGESDNPISDSLFYHAIYVRPRWSRVFSMVKKINNHIFYTYNTIS